MVCVEFLSESLIEDGLSVCSAVYIVWTGSGDYY